MKSLPQKSDQVVARETKSLLLAIKFLENRKRNFDSVVALCEKAPLWQISDSQYLVGFSRDQKGITLAQAVLEEMRIASWKVIVFADGRIIGRLNALRNMLDCASGCSRSKNPNSYCPEIFDSPMEHFAKRGAFEFSLDELGDPLPEEFAWKLPCKLLNGFVSFSKDELNDPVSRIERASEERLTCVCPYFDIKRFEIKEKPKKVSRAKTYW